MTESLFIPQPGYRFYFKDHSDSIFEIGFASNNIVRYAAIAGGKIFKIGLDEFENRYKSGEILCTYAPEKLILNPKHSSEIHRKERYIISALQKLESPTSLTQLRKLISEVAQDISDDNPPSPRSVARWIYKYRSHSCNKLYLKNNYKGNSSLRFPPEIYQIINQGIHEIYLKPEYRTSKDVKAYMLGRFIEEGISLELLPSLRSIQRHIKKLDPYTTLKIKQGSRIAKKTFQAAGRSIISPFALYMVEIDTHYLDIIVIDPKTNIALGRPFLACAIDVYSRAIVGTYISMYPPSAATTLAVLKDMISRPAHGLPGGIPSIIIPDNGVEFKNNSLARVCEQLKITLTASQVGTPNNKPHIERFFNTLTHGILQKLPGTTFSNSIEKGNYDSTKLAQLTLEQLNDFIDKWINNVYHQSIHSSTGRSPSTMWQDAIEDIKPSFLTETDAKILCRKPVERTIHHGQVQIDGLSYFSHALTTLQAQGIKKVTVLIDDLNLNEVYIIDPINTDVIIQADSTNQDYTQGLSRIAHLEVQKRKKIMSKRDQQQLGNYIDLYHLYGLLQDIQLELIRNRPRLKPLKLEIPKLFEQLNIDSHLKIKSEKDELSTSFKLADEEIPVQSFGSIEVPRRGKY